MAGETKKAAARARYLSKATSEVRVTLIQISWCPASRSGIKKASETLTGSLDRYQRQSAGRDHSNYIQQHREKRTELEISRRAAFFFAFGDEGLEFFLDPKINRRGFELCNDAFVHFMRPLGGPNLSTEAPCLEIRPV